MADELSKKEKAFRELLSDIKYKSEIMRKKKRNQDPSQKLKPGKGQPSFMPARDNQEEIEHMLRLKVDSNVVKDFLQT